jgi:hypothetical protein
VSDRLSPVKNSAKNDALSPPFKELLGRVCNGEEPGMFFPPDDDGYRAWIKDFANRAYAILERLYLRHGIPPARPLEIIALGVYCRMGTYSIPTLLTNSKLREKSATAMEKVADDLEAVCHEIILAPRLRSTPEFRDKLRQYARHLRAIGLRADAHRPRDVVFGDTVAMLTNEFFERTGKRLLDLTGDLMELAMDHHVADMKGSVKSALKIRRSG